MGGKQKAFYLELVEFVEEIGRYDGSKDRDRLGCGSSCQFTGKGEKIVTASKTKNGFCVKNEKGEGVEYVFPKFKLLRVGMQKKVCMDLTFEKKVEKKGFHSIREISHGILLDETQQPVAEKFAKNSVPQRKIWEVEKRVLSLTDENNNNVT